MAEYYEVVGFTEVDLQKPYQAESNLGDVITDAMSSAWAEAGIALINDGGIRSSIAEGDITKEDLYGVSMLE